LNFEAWKLKVAEPQRLEAAAAAVPQASRQLTTGTGNVCSKGCHRQVARGQLQVITSRVVAAGLWPRRKRRRHAGWLWVSSAWGHVQHVTCLP